MNLGTNPLDEDTDGDGHLDGSEVAAGTDPTSANSYPTTPTPTLIVNDPVSLLLLTIFAVITGVLCVLCVYLFNKTRILKKEINISKDKSIKLDSPKKKSIQVQPTKNSRK